MICPAVNAFRPDVIVTQDGADPHHVDPLAHLTVTMATFPRLYAALHDLADSAAGGRWVALGGGGYADDIVPRAWAMLFSELAGIPVPDEVPDDWHRAAEERTGHTMSRRLLDDTEPEVPAGERARADLEGDRVIDEAKIVLI